MKYTAVVALIFAGLGACAAQSDKPETLADIARKVKAEKKAAVVFSDDNLRRIPADAVSTASSEKSSQSSATASAQAGSETAAPSGATKKEPTSASADKKGGDKSSTDLKAELDKVKSQQQGWENSSKHYEELLQTEKDEFRRQMYEDALNNDRGNAAAFKRKADDLESQLNKQKETSAGDGTQSAKTSPGQP